MLLLLIFVCGMKSLRDSPEQICKKNERLTSASTSDLNFGIIQVPLVPIEVPYQVEVRESLARTSPDL